MITVMKWGAMYGQLEDGDVIASDPVQLGDHIVTPGTQIERIGSKRRSLFEMQDGYYIQYVGMVDRNLLFTSHPTGCDGNPWFYAFAYVSPTTLLCLDTRSGWDIKVDELIIRDHT